MKEVQYIQYAQHYNLSMLSPRRGGLGICGAFDYQLHTHPGDFDWHSEPELEEFEPSNCY